MFWGKQTMRDKSLQIWQLTNNSVKLFSHLSSYLNSSNEPTQYHNNLVQRGAAGASADSSIINQFILCLLLKTGALYVWWNWHSASFEEVNSVMTQGKLAGSKTGFVGFTKGLCDSVVMRQSRKWQVCKMWHLKTKWLLYLETCGNYRQNNRVLYPHLQRDLTDIN